MFTFVFQAPDRHRPSGGGGAADVDTDSGPTPGLDR